MRAFIKVFLFIQCALMNSTSANPLVGRGVRRAESIDFPSAVSMFKKPSSDDTSKQSICGGTLITPIHVLTVKKCFINEKNGRHTMETRDIRVIVGSNELTKESDMYEVNFMETYEQWLAELEETPEEGLSHNLMVATLKTYVKNATPIPISQLSKHELLGEQVESVGWGSTKSSLDRDCLHKVSLKVISDGRAKKNYKVEDKKASKYLKNHLFTVGDPPVGFGKGDYGTPLLHKGQLVGINDHNCLPAHTGYGDHPEDHPNVHTAHQSVAYYRPFIESYIKKYEADPNFMTPLQSPPQSPPKSPPKSPSQSPPKSPPRFTSPTSVLPPETRRRRRRACSDGECIIL